MLFDAQRVVQVFGLACEYWSWLHVETYRACKYSFHSDLPLYELLHVWYRGGSDKCHESQHVSVLIFVLRVQMWPVRYR